MSRKTIRVSVSAFVIIGALSLLMYTTVSEGAEYYKHVDEVMVAPEQWYGKRLQLHGHVLGDPLIKADTLEYRFQIHANGKVVNATYTGVVPDTFKKDAEVVVKGRLGPDGIAIERNGIMAKCPSRYEADMTTPVIPVTPSAPPPMVR